MSEKYGIVTLPQTSGGGPLQVKMNKISEKESQMRDLQFDYIKALNKH
jgi:hypothetical protein